MPTAMEPIPGHGSRQASQAEATKQKIEGMEPDELIRFIQQKKPKLLKGDRLAEFKNAGIFGESFLSHANDVGWFQNTCNLSPGLSDMLVNLARELIGRAMPYTPRRQQANNVTGNRQQAGDVEMFDTASKSLLPIRTMVDLAYLPQTYPPQTYPPQSYPQPIYPQQIYPQFPYGVALQPSYPPQGLPYGPPQQQYGPPDVVAITGRGTAGIKSKFTIFIHAHYVDCKLTTSQETSCRWEMLSRARSPCLSPGLRLRLWRQRSHWKPPVTAGARQQPLLVSGGDPDRVYRLSFLTSSSLLLLLSLAYP